MRNAEWGMGNAEWGMGNAECGMGKAEWGMRNAECGWRMRNEEGGEAKGPEVYRGSCPLSLISAAFLFKPSRSISSVL